MVTAGYFRMIDGVWHKRCTGPAHETETFLPWNEKYFYPDRTASSRKFKAKCRLCENWATLESPGMMGYISSDKVWRFYQEAVSRVGIAELSRRSGVDPQAISKVLRHKVPKVRKTSFRKILLELISMRRKNEHSINGHSRWRNERRLISPIDACDECGGHLDNFTEGCDTCWERKRGRERRSQAA
jgi:hypothetical protein